MSFWRRLFPIEEQPPAPEPPALHPWSSQAQCATTIKPAFIIEPQFAQRWNAYATAALPNELGAVVRIVERDGAYVAVDFQVLEQEVTPAYFEFTTAGQAQFQMDMATSGRGEELAEWYGMIHSHPNMTPFMSGTDVDNLWKLAGNKIGFSLICSTHSDPERNYFSVNYAQGGPVPLMIKNINHQGSAFLGGTGDISASQAEQIAAEVQQLAHPRAVFSSNWSPAPPLQSAPVYSAPPVNEDWETDTLFAPTLVAEQELGEFDQQEIDLSLVALELAEAEGWIAPSEVSEILSALEGESSLRDEQADLLISAVGELPDEQFTAAAQVLIDKLSQALDSQEL